MGVSGILKHLQGFGVPEEGSLALGLSSPRKLRYTLLVKSRPWD
jgi:hypothetical protein